MQVKIGNTMWALEEIAQKEMRSKNPECIGLCVYDQRAMYVLKNMSKRMKSITVAHELAHAVIAQYGIPFRDANQEEEYVSRMDEVIYRVSQVMPEEYK